MLELELRSLDSSSRSLRTQLDAERARISDLERRLIHQAPSHKLQSPSPGGSGANSALIDTKPSIKSPHSILSPDASQRFTLKRKQMTVAVPSPRPSQSSQRRRSSGAGSGGGSAPVSALYRDPQAVFAALDAESEGWGTPGSAAAGATTTVGGAGVHAVTGSSLAGLHEVVAMDSVRTDITGSVTPAAVSTGLNKELQEDHKHNASSTETTHTALLDQSLAGVAADGIAPSSGGVGYSWSGTVQPALLALSSSASTDSAALQAVMAPIRPSMIHSDTLVSSQLHAVDPFPFFPAYTPADAVSSAHPGVHAAADLAVISSLVSLVRLSCTPMLHHSNSQHCAARTASSIAGSSDGAVVAFAGVPKLTLSTDDRPLKRVRGSDAPDVTGGDGMMAPDSTGAVIRRMLHHADTLEQCFTAAAAQHGSTAACLSPLVRLMQCALLYAQLDGASTAGGSDAGHRSSRLMQWQLCAPVVVRSISVLHAVLALSGSCRSAALIRPSLPSSVQSLGSAAAARSPSDQLPSLHPLLGAMFPRISSSIAPAAGTGGSRLDSSQSNAHRHTGSEDRHAGSSGRKRSVTDTADTAPVDELYACEDLVPALVAMLQSWYVCMYVCLPAGSCVHARLCIELMPYHPALFISAPGGCLFTLARSMDSAVASAALAAHYRPHEHSNKPDSPAARPTDHDRLLAQPAVPRLLGRGVMLQGSGVPGAATIRHIVEGTLRVLLSLLDCSSGSDLGVPAGHDGSEALTLLKQYQRNMISDNDVKLRRAHLLTRLV